MGNFMYVSKIKKVHPLHLGVNPQMRVGTITLYLLLSFVRVTMVLNRWRDYTEYRASKTG